MKTKAQEITILKFAISELGPDSYLAPWLQSVAGEVESLVRSDIIPDITIAQHQKRGEEIIAEARKHAAEIVRTAQNESEKIKHQAERARGL